PCPPPNGPGQSRPFVASAARVSWTCSQKQKAPADGPAPRPFDEHARPSERIGAWGAWGSRPEVCNPNALRVLFVPESGRGHTRRLVVAQVPHEGISTGMIRRITCPNCQHVGTTSASLPRVQ